MRINKYLAKTGLGSRRQCDEIIKNKLIKVNGQILDDFSYQVNKNDITWKQVFAGVAKTMGSDLDVYIEAAHGFTESISLGSTSSISGEVKHTSINMGIQLNM